MPYCCNKCQNNFFLSEVLFVGSQQEKIEENNVKIQMTWTSGQPGWGPKFFPDQVFFPFFLKALWINFVLMI